MDFLCSIRCCIQGNKIVLVAKKVNSYNSLLVELRLSFISFNICCCRLESILFKIYNYKFTNMLFFLTFPSDDPCFPVPCIYFSCVHLNKLLFLFTYLSLLISYNTFELQFMVDGFAFLA